MSVEHPRTLVPPETVAAFAGDDLRARIFHDKYALRSADGTVVERTPEELWRRLAGALAALEAPERRQEWTAQFSWLLSDFRMVPGGRVLHAIGNPNQVTALNCYVIASPADSVPGIYHTASELAETMKRGGGVGLDISSLRPKGAPARNAARTSTGAVSFMELFSLTTGLIGQEGRRGALMLTISDAHPDVLDFCRVKRNLDKVRYANISVRVSDAFLHAVDRDDEWLLHYENTTDRIAVKHVIRARELWEELIRGAREFAEPGCLYWSTIQRFSVSDCYAEMRVVSTNPCAEEPLEPYGECCLGSLNLAAFVLDPFTPAAAVAQESLERATRLSVRFLDNLLTWNRGRHPLPQQEEAAEHGRRIGVGIMGLADMLCQLGLRYDTDEAIAKTEEVLRAIKLWAYDESANLAAEKGPFPLFDARRHFDNPFFASFPPALIEKMQRDGLRNVTLLTIPPTGTVASLAGCTSGIEPIFDLQYTRRSESLSQDTFAVTHPLVRQYHQQNGSRETGLLPEYFVTAHVINPEKRVLMQATAQHHIDQAISGTINLPSDTTVETVGRLYRRAWEAGCKGITVYRSGSRENILTPAHEQHATIDVRVAPRPPVLPGLTIREETPLGTAFVTINYAETPCEPFEAFLRLGKAGSDLEADAEAIGRLLSLLLRLPSPMSRLERLQAITEQLAMIGGARSIGFGPERVRSMPDGIARALSHYLETAQNGSGYSTITTQTPSDRLIAPQRTAPALLTAPQSDFCPRCRQATLLVSEGCLRCTECGFKEC